MSVDLTACDREPIHVPGSIQPHGVLLALTEPSLSVTHVSVNVRELLGLDPEGTIGRSLEDVLGGTAGRIVREALAQPHPELVSPRAHLGGECPGQGLDLPLHPAHRHAGARVSTPLSSLLREGTREKHRLAEEAPFVRALLAGRVLHGAYACFLQSLRFIYSEMEAVLDGRFDLPGLRRLPALEEDLSWWSPYERPTPSPATRAYVERIRACSPAQRVGHFYTRYLGDLYGGEVLMRAVARTFGLSHEGLAFYRFDDRVQLRQRFREALDGVEVDAATSERIVAEACRAFDHNARLFEELT